MLRLLAHAFQNALRRTVRQPRFVFTVSLVFVLGLGANGIVFGMIDRLLFQAPKHVEDPVQLRRVVVERTGTLAGTRTPRSVLAYPVVNDMMEVPGISAVAGYADQKSLLGTRATAVSIPVQLVTGSFFRLLGTSLALGRPITPEDDGVGASPTAVISHGLWQRRFGGTRSVIGEELLIDGVSYAIIGVAPPGFTGAELAPVDVWLPLHVVRKSSVESWERNRLWNILQVVVRLDESVNPEVVESQATAVHRAQHRELAGDGRYDPEASVVLSSLIAARGPTASGEQRVARWLPIVSLLVLIIAAANVSNLLLARSVQRRDQTGVALALGAPANRVVAEGVLEGLIPAGIAAALTLVLVAWVGGPARSWLLPEVAWSETALDGRMVLFVLVLSLLCGLAAGVAPAVWNTTRDVRSLLTGGGRGVSRSSRGRQGLVIVQAALSMVLLVGAALFVRSLLQARSTEFGYDAASLLVVEPVLDGEWANAVEQRQYYREVTRRIQQLPAVSSAAAAGLTVPFRQQLFVNMTRGASHVPSEERRVFLTAVSPGYFSTVGQSVVRGRPFSDEDREGTAPALVVSESLAGALWPDQEPIGRCLGLEAFAEEVDCAMVVGVVADARRGGLEESNQKHVFVSLNQPILRWGGPDALLIRTRPNAESDVVAGAIRDELFRASPRIRFATVQPLEDLIDPLARSWRIGAVLFSLLGGLALLISVFGMYSLSAFEVSQRRKELAIRSALGASGRRLVGEIVRRAAVLAAIGIGTGLIVVTVAAPYMQGLLFKTNAIDLSSLVFAAVALLGAAVAAALFPGRNAVPRAPARALTDT